MEIDLGAILSWLRYRKIKKNRKVTEDALMSLHALTVTIHGRQMLSAVCKDPDNGLPDEIRWIYWNLMKQAPISDYARWN